MQRQEMYEVLGRGQENNRLFRGKGGCRAAAKATEKDKCLDAAKTTEKRMPGSGQGNRKKHEMLGTWPRQRLLGRQDTCCDLKGDELLGSGQDN